MKYSFNIIKNNYEYKISLSKEFIDDKFLIMEKNINKITILTFLGGVVGGSLGVGGGIITTPLLLEFGLIPKVKNKFK